MIEHTSFTLDNGLRVVHHLDPSTSHVAVALLYNVGARDEMPGLTGMAHLFEHLMFGGSVNVPDYDYAIEMAGGTNNAWTSNDFTYFYDVLPAANVETAFWAESDRMLQLDFSERSLEVQRSVVIEEFKQVCLNKPYGDMGHLLRDLLYKVHPYRYPTIGRAPEDLERVTLDDIRRFFYSHYAPNNAVLSVAGPVEADRVRELAEKWFGSIPRREIAPRDYPAEPPITEARRLEVVRPVPQSRIIIAFPMDAYGTDDYRVADIITDILASGQSSRLNRRLVVGTDLFTEADASIAGSEEPGFLQIGGATTDNSDATIRKAEEALWQEIRRLTDEEVSEHELERALNRFESNLTFSHINYTSKCRDLAMAEIHGEDLNRQAALYRRITPADIRRVAALLQPRRSATLLYRANP